MSKKFSFMCSTLDDCRRIQLHENNEFIRAYQQRGDNDDLLEVAHDLTKLRRVDSSKLFESAMLFEQPYMQQIEYSIEREYPLHACVNLPEPTTPGRPFNEVLLDRRSDRTFGGIPLGRSGLGSLLFGAIGETGRIITGQEDDRPIYASMRSIPSAGGLQPTRVFVAIVKQGELDCGLYHYDAPQHALEVVKPIDEDGFEALFAAFPIHPKVVDLTQAAAIFFVSSIWWRARAKYGPRGHRYCQVEAGCACQNLSLTAVGLGLAHVLLGGFYDDEVHSFLGLDGVEHSVIATIAVGARSPESQGESRNAEF
jgi:SagB-type dehydrogenase family enzyme